MNLIKLGPKYTSEELGKMFAYSKLSEKNLGCDYNSQASKSCVS